MPAKIVVIGLGNPLLLDDGLGAVAIRRLRDQSLPSAVELVEAETQSLDALIDASDADRVIVVDAIDAQAKPGTIVRLGGEDLLGSPHSRLCSLHQLSFAEALCLAELGGFSRDRLTVIGLQPSAIKPAMHLSAEVEANLDTLLREIMHEIQEAGNGSHREETD